MADVEGGDYDDDDDEAPQQKPKKKPSANEDVIIACGVCKKMYKDKSMCPNCDVVLKGKGE